MIVVLLTLWLANTCMILAKIAIIHLPIAILLFMLIYASDAIYGASLISSNAPSDLLLLLSWSMGTFKEDH